jgi:hypothetical protein
MATKPTPSSGTSWKQALERAQIAIIESPNRQWLSCNKDALRNSLSVQQRRDFVVDRANESDFWASGSNHESVPEEEEFDHVEIDEEEGDDFSDDEIRFSDDDEDNNNNNNGSNSQSSSSFEITSSTERLKDMDKDDRDTDKDDHKKDKPPKSKTTDAKRSSTKRTKKHRRKRSRKSSKQALQFSDDESIGGSRSDINAYGVFDPSNSVDTAYSGIPVIGGTEDDADSDTHDSGSASGSAYSMPDHVGELGDVESSSDEKAQRLTECGIADKRDSVCNACDVCCHTACSNSAWRYCSLCYRLVVAFDHC